MASPHLTVPYSPKASAIPSSHDPSTLVGEFSPCSRFWPSDRTIISDPNLYMIKENMVYAWKKCYQDLIFLQQCLLFHINHKNIYIVIFLANQLIEHMHTHTRVCVCVYYFLSITHITECTLPYKTVSIWVDFFFFFSAWWLATLGPDLWHLSQYFSSTKKNAWGAT